MNSVRNYRTAVERRRAAAPRRSDIWNKSGGPSRRAVRSRLCAIIIIIIIIFFILANFPFRASLLSLRETLWFYRFAWIRGNSPVIS